MKIDLMMPCPACVHEQNSYSEKWTHAGCGGVLCIDERAIVYCKACGKKAHIAKMYMSCNKHKFVRPTKLEITSAVSIGRMSRRNDIVSWLNEFLKHL